MSRSWRTGGGVFSAGGMHASFSLKASNLSALLVLLLVLVLLLLVLLVLLLLGVLDVLFGKPEGGEEPLPSGTFSGGASHQAGVGMLVLVLLLVLECGWAGRRVWAAWESLLNPPAPADDAAVDDAPVADARAVDAADAPAVDDGDAPAVDDAKAVGLAESLLTLLSLRPSSCLVMLLLVLLVLLLGLALLALLLLAWGE